MNHRITYFRNLQSIMKIPVFLIATRNFESLHSILSTIIADVRVQGFFIVVAWVAQLSTNLWGESFHRCDVITSVGDDVLLFECTLLHNYLDEHLVFVTLKKIIILFL